MAKNAHLVLDERATIEVRLRERASFTEIGRELGKDPSTISKEVRLHSQTVRKDSFNPCSKRSTCDEYGTACSKCKLQYSKSCKRCPRVKCYEHCRQFEVVLLKPQTPEIVLEEKQFQEQVYAAVMKLPEKQAKRIYARYYLGMTVNEIAEVEGVDPSRVRDSIRRGLKQLVKYF